jgi:hypothetical protein
MSNATRTKFVCLLGALSPEERSRQQALREQLEAAVTGIRELPNGYQFSYGGDPMILRLAGEWMSLEQRCCPYFDFALQWNSAMKGAALSLTGGEGVKEFIAQTFRVGGEGGVRAIS